MLLGRKSIPQVNNAIGLHTVGSREEGWSTVAKEANKNKSPSGALKEIRNTICAKRDKRTMGCTQKPVQPRVPVSGPPEQQRPQQEAIAVPLFIPGLCLHRRQACTAVVRCTWKPVYPQATVSGHLNSSGHIAMAVTFSYKVVHIYNV